MDVNKILQELREEGLRIGEAILSLERLAASQSGHKRRGRPPKWLTEAWKKAPNGESRKGGIEKKKPEK